MASNSKKSLAPPFGALFLVSQTVLVTLKLTNQIDWSWWGTLLPTWIYVGQMTVSLLAVILLVRFVLKRADDETLAKAKESGAFARFIRDVDNACGNDDDEDEDDEE